MKLFCKEYWISRMARMGLLGVDISHIERGCRRLRGKAAIKLQGQARGRPRSVPQ
jgi:hypothetical protein